MPNVHTTLSSLFTDIANAIRAKTGSSAQIVADNFPTEIANISTGIDPSDATATADDIVAPKTAYTANGKETGTLQDKGVVNVILDTATTIYNIVKGKYNNGSVSIVTQTKTVNPSTVQQTIGADAGKVISSFTVNAIQTQTKSATPSTNAQTVTPDSGKFLTQVNVGAIPNQHSGKQGDITPSTSAQTVYVPSGWHDGSTYFSVGASTGGINGLVQVATGTVGNGIQTTFSLEEGKTYYVISSTDTLGRQMYLKSSSANSIYCISRASVSNMMNPKSKFLTTSVGTDYFYNKMYFMSDTQQGLALLRAYADSTLTVYLFNGVRDETIVLYQVV